MREGKESEVTTQFIEDSNLPMLNTLLKIKEEVVGRNSILAISVRKIRSNAAFFGRAEPLCHQMRRSSRCVTFDWWYECPTSLQRLCQVLDDVPDREIMSHKLL